MDYATVTAAGLDIAERAGAFLIILAIAAACVATVVHSRAALIGATIAVGIAALVPVDGLSITDYVYSLVGPLSGASLVILIVALADRGAPSLRLDQALGLPALACILIVIGVPFYAAVLGSGAVDVYRWGYGGWPLPLALALVLVVGFLARAVSVALWIALSGVLYLAGVYASRNLFDYLIDPVAVMLAGLVLAKVAANLAIRRLRRAR